MVLRLKARESRSPPGPPWAEKPKTKPDPGQQNITRTTPFQNAPEPINAGWSSPVARQAHNLKVAGSNPAPATTFVITRSKHRSDFGPAILTACGAVVFLRRLRGFGQPSILYSCIVSLLPLSSRSEEHTSELQS